MKADIQCFEFLKIIVYNLHLPFVLSDGMSLLFLVQQSLQQVINWNWTRLKNVAGCTFMLDDGARSVPWPQLLTFSAFQRRSHDQSN